MFEYTFNFEGVEISAKAEEVGTVYKWNAEKIESEISVSANGQEITFSFFAPDAIANETDLASCLLCLCSDAALYLNARDINDFQSELGFTKVSECLEAWEGCKEQAEKIALLGVDPFALYDYLTENYDI